MRQTLKERIDSWLFYSEHSVKHKPEQVLLHPDDKPDARALTLKGVYIGTNLPVNFLGENNG